MDGEEQGKREVRVKRRHKAAGRNWWEGGRGGRREGEGTAHCPPSTVQVSNASGGSNCGSGSSSRDGHKAEPSTYI